MRQRPKANVCSLLAERREDAGETCGASVYLIDVLFAWEPLQTLIQRGEKMDVRAFRTGDGSGGKKARGERRWLGEMNRWDEAELVWGLCRRERRSELGVDYGLRSMRGREGWSVERVEVGGREDLRTSESGGSSGRSWQVRETGGERSVGFVFEVEERKLRVWVCVCNFCSALL